MQLDTVLSWERWAVRPWIRGPIPYCQSQRNGLLIQFLSSTLLQFLQMCQKWKWSQSLQYSLKIWTFLYKCMHLELIFHLEKNGQLIPFLGITILNFSLIIWNFNALIVYALASPRNNGKYIWKYGKIIKIYFNNKRLQNTFPHKDLQKTHSYVGVTYTKIF